LGLFSCIFLKGFEKWHFIFMHFYGDFKNGTKIGLDTFGKIKTTTTNFKISYLGLLEAKVWYWQRNPRFEHLGAIFIIFTEI